MPRANGAQRPMLLTMQRVNNVGVFLCRLKLSPSEAVAAIMACCGDSSCETASAAKEGGNGARDLTDVDLEGLLHCMPTVVGHCDKYCAFYGIGIRQICSESFQSHKGWQLLGAAGPM